MAEALRCIQTSIHSKAIAQQILNTDHLIHVVLLLLTNNVMMIGISSWVVGEVIQHSEQGATYVTSSAHLIIAPAPPPPPSLHLTNECLLSTVQFSLPSKL